MCFLQDSRAALLKEKPDIANTGIMTELAKRWTALPKDKREVCVYVCGVLLWSYYCGVGGIGCGGSAKV